MTAPLETAVAALHAFVRRLRARVILTRATDAVLTGFATALMVLLAATVAGAGARTARVVTAAGAGTLAAAGLLFARRRDWSRERIVAGAEAALPSLRNYLVTALELEAHPERASERIRANVATRAAGLVGEASLDAVHPRRRALRSGAGAIACAVAVTWLALANPSIGPSPRGLSPATGSQATDNTSGIGRFDAVVTPPAYTGAAVTTVTNPERLDVLAGSRIAVRVTGRDAVTIALGTIPVELRRETSETVSATITPAVSEVLTITARGAVGEVADRRLLPIVVRPDAAPDVTIDRPGRDLTFETATGRVTIAAHANDDLGLSALTLHYTTVTGSGEQYSFKEGELPLTIVRERATAWRGEASRDLASLDLHDGDLLVYYASAADRRPAAERAVSDSYVIEIGKPHTAIAGGFAAPPEEDKAAISMSALLAKTERLHAAKPRLAADAFTGQAAGLAVEQRMVRSETLFLMGAHGEVEDEEAEAEHSNEIQEGRLENRGQSDLLEATRLMSAAERSLLVADTAAALPVQRAALAALQRAMSKQRYFLRTVPVRSQIDPARRLSGDLSEAHSWERTPGGGGGDPRAAQVQQLLADLAACVEARGKTPANPTELAARVLALDPSSAPLQAAARELTRLTGAGIDWSTAETSDGLSRVVSALRGVLTGTAAVPAPPAFSSGALRGAHADALRREGRQP